MRRTVYLTEEQQKRFKPFKTTDERQSCYESSKQRDKRIRNQLWESHHSPIENVENYDYKTAFSNSRKEHRTALPSSIDVGTIRGNNLPDYIRQNSGIDDLQVWRSLSHSKKENTLDMRTAELAKWVAERQWSHWCTFTFSEPTSDYSARKHITRMYETWKHSGLRCLYFVIEHGEKYGRTHLHALCLFENESAQLVWEWWLNKYGRNQIRPFEYEGGAVEYIANYFRKGTIDWDILGKPKTKTITLDDDCPF